MKMISNALSKVIWIEIMISLFNLVESESKFNSFLNVVIFLTVGTLLTYILDLIDEKFKINDIT